MIKEVIKTQGLEIGWALHIPKTAAGCGGLCEHAEGRPYVAESGLEGYGEEPAALLKNRLGYGIWRWTKEALIRRRHVAARNDVSNPDADTVHLENGTVTTSSASCFQ
jgi:hypothetical protein